MKISSYFVNQYRNRDFIRYNQVKFKVVCIVLDYLTFCKGQDVNAIFTRDNVERKIYAAVKKNKFNKAAVEMTLAEMEIMNLVKEDKKNIFFAGRWI